MGRLCGRAYLDTHGVIAPQGPEVPLPKAAWRRIEAQEPSDFAKLEGQPKFLNSMGNWQPLSHFSDCFTTPWDPQWSLPLRGAGGAAWPQGISAPPQIGSRKEDRRTRTYHKQSVQEEERIAVKRLGGTYSDIDCDTFIDVVVASSGDLPGIGGSAKQAQFALDVPRSPSPNRVLNPEDSAGLALTMVVNRECGFLRVRGHVLNCFQVDRGKLMHSNAAQTKKWGSAVACYRIFIQGLPARKSRWLQPLNRVVFSMLRRAGHACEFRAGYLFAVADLDPSVTVRIDFAPPREVQSSCAVNMLA